MGELPEIFQPYEEYTFKSKGNPVSKLCVIINPGKVQFLIEGEVKHFLFHRREQLDRLKAFLIEAKRYLPNGLEEKREEP